MSNDLAILGGQRALPEGTVLPAPPTSSRDEEMVLASLRSSTHAWGSNCEALQSEWAAWNGNRHCIAVTSGTAALHMALVASGLVPGDEVLTPAYSWTSSVSCILHHRCIPVFVDIDEYSNIDPAKIEAAITPRTRAIIVVHLHGVPADMDAILAIAARHNLAVIEDACQAHGALYKGKKVGTLAPCTAFSLNQNKMLSAGEGGLFVTDDDAMAERARSMVLFGDFRAPLEEAGNHYYGTGWMIRYNELCAAYARAQLTRLDEYIDAARAMFGVLRQELAGVPGLILPVEPAYARENAYNFVCHVDPEAVGYEGPANFFREAMVTALAAEGVPAGVWQRRILPEMAAVAARDAFGNGSPWKEHGSTVEYRSSDYPASLYHSATYFILNNLRLPNTPETARQIAGAMRKVFCNAQKLNIDELARNADVSIYERGWKRHASSL